MAVRSTKSQYPPSPSTPSIAGTCSRAKRRRQRRRWETASAASKAGKRPPGRKELDAYTVEQRGQIAFWMDTVAEWREFRRGSGKAEETDRDFVERLKARHPGLQISKATLYRKWQAVRTGDWDSLVENRGKAAKGQTSIHPAAWEVFCGIYLQQTKLSVERSMELTEEWAMQNAVNALPLPSAATFQRAVREKIPPETLCFTPGGAARMVDTVQPVHCPALRQYGEQPDVGRRYVYAGYLHPRRERAGAQDVLICLGGRTQRHFHRLEPFGRKQEPEQRERAA